MVEVKTLKLNYDISPISVDKFKTFGDFENNVDDNKDIKLSLNINTSSADNGNLYYTSIPLKVYQYDIDKIKELNNVEFTEFNSEEDKTAESENDQSVITEDYSHLISENTRLNNTINELINKYENNDSDQVIAAMKQEIIDLRIQLGQGESSSDFSDDFPYLPK